MFNKVFIYGFLLGTGIGGIGYILNKNMQKYRPHPSTPVISGALGAILMFTTMTTIEYIKH